MIIYKNFIDYKMNEFMKYRPNENLLTIPQREKLQASAQAETSIPKMEERLTELDKSEKLNQQESFEKMQLKQQLARALEDILTAVETESILAEIKELDELVYVVDDNSELAKKIMESAPYFDFVLDGNSELVDIIPLPKPVVIPELTETELTQQAITDLELTTIEQGQQITALEILVLEGTKNV